MHVLIFFYLHAGRCTTCEPISCKIVHPPSGNHIGADYNELRNLFEYLNGRDYRPSAADSIAESDFVYFDSHRDAKFAEVGVDHPLILIRWRNWLLNCLHCAKGRLIDVISRIGGEVLMNSILLLLLFLFFLAL
jgi:hypothetical protein